MIICKYTKIREAAFFPHLDVLRTVGMAIRRTGLSINFSEGFNPHARLFFSQPLPLGTESVCEYFCADSNDDANEFMDRINSSLPKTIQVLKAQNVPQNPNVAALVASADYRVELQKGGLSGVDYSKVLEKDELVIEFVDKGVVKQKDVRSLVFKLKNDEKNIYLTLACGNVNLRAERLASFLLKSTFKGQEQGYKIAKTAVYDKNGMDLDRILFNVGGQS